MKAQAKRDRAIVKREIQQLQKLKDEVERLLKTQKE